MICNAYLTSLLLSTMSMYMGSPVIFKIGTGYLHLYVYCGLLYTVTLLYFLRLYYLTSAGQHLGDSMKKAKCKLEEFKCRNQRVWNAEMELLKEDLSSHLPCPISPYGAFGLSNGALPGTFATILTYLIVLIQFKASESSSSSLPSLNSNATIQNTTIQI